MSNATFPAPTDQNRVLAKSDQKPLEKNRQQDQAQLETTRQQEQWLAPTVDIFETEAGLTVVADLPGVNKKNLDIEVKDDLLTIRAKADVSIPGVVNYQEFQLGSFFRQFRLADTVDTNRIQAQLNQGVLTLHLPKAEEAQPRKIDVQIS